MKKFIIGMVACLPMLGIAQDFKLTQNPNSLTLVALDRLGSSVSAVSGNCLNVNLQRGSLSSVLPIPILTTTLENARGVCEMDKPITIVLTLGDRAHPPTGTFLLEFEHGPFTTAKNLRVLHAQGLEFSFERIRTQNIIYVKRVSTEK